MANSVGGIIEATDYNTIRNKVIAILGTGSTSFGYGQAARVQSSAVSSGNIVTATQWGNLRYDIYNCLVHQTGTTPSIVQVSPGATVRYGSSNPNNAYDTFANTITSNRFNIGSGQYVTEALANKSSGDISWAGSLQIDVTCTFSTAETARHFFNSGGQLRVRSAFVRSRSEQQSIQWENLLAAAGTQGLGGQVPTTGFSPMNGQNWYRLTNSPQTWYSLNSSGAYSSNSYILQAWSNVSNNSGGTANIVYFRMRMVDAYTDPGTPAPGDLVGGTTTIYIDQLRPTGVMQPAPSTGNFTVSGPSTTTIGSYVYS